MSSLTLTSTPLGVLASWVVIRLVGFAIIACAVVASLYAPVSAIAPAIGA